MYGWFDTKSSMSFARSCSEAREASSRARVGAYTSDALSGLALLPPLSVVIEVEDPFR